MMSSNAGTIGSLWAASQSVPSFRSGALQEEKRFDIAIVGGGFTGLAAALHAAELGSATCLLEAETVGFGASGRNGGQVNPGLKLDEAALAARFGERGKGLYRLGQEGPEFLADLISRKAMRCHFERNGLFRLAHNRNALGTIRTAAAALRKAGIPAEDLDAAEVRARVGTDRYPGGLFDPRGASVHPLDLSHELARAAAQAGAAIYTQSPATSLQRSGVRWRITTPSGAVLARKVLIATGAYTDGLVPNLARSLLPVNSFQVATEPLGARGDTILPGRQTVYDSRRLVLYFRKSPDGRLVLGGRASFSSSRTTSEKVADYSILQNVLHQIFPDISGVPITYAWTGLVDITLDYLPHYHALPDDLHVISGFNGRGVALSHRVGAWLGRKLAGQPETFDIPATQISPFPFHAWRETLLNLGMKWNRALDALGY
jgi:sarcosine oxidase